MLPKLNFVSQFQKANRNEPKKTALYSTISAVIKKVLMKRKCKHKNFIITTTIYM